MTPNQSSDILLVEDNPADAELTLRSLKNSNLANDVTLVEDGEAALDYLFCRGHFADRDVHYPPKVVLLDLKLPKLNGLEVLRAMRNDERTHFVPVVILTSSSEDPDIKSAYALGVNSYVVKPVEFHDFAEAVSRVGLYWLLVNQQPR
jgi:two-component system, response regulator